MATVCGSWIFGVCPGAFLFMFFDVDVNSPPWAAMFFSGTALMMACTAGGIAGTFPPPRRAHGFARRPDRRTGPTGETAETWTRAASTATERRRRARLRIPRLGLGPASAAPECGSDRREHHRAVAAGYDRLAVRYEATVLAAAVNEWL
ncbi:hypothetical protein M2158_000162 [Streptomyces sp. SAI-144]|uniref:hypothetical protein n=1 Tax=unclassified Streptomyces TaxID=2593676 RepID=UPI0024754117|nr:MULTISPECIES: hypothetical protein [unclassified Streptomyces]MDH6431685.1 hypothetical protein [Streptomyces sp. SAI-144]MDH6492957.1 hypothetical protein [Streptomyces sp. SAI-127]